MKDPISIWRIAMTELRKRMIECLRHQWQQCFQTIVSGDHQDDSYSEALKILLETEILIDREKDVKF